MLETFKVHLLYPKLISSGTATAQKVPRICLQVLWRVSASGMTQWGHYPGWLGLHLVFVPKLSPDGALSLSTAGRSCSCAQGATQQSHPSVM